MINVTSTCNWRAEALTEEVIGPSMALATAAALERPEARSRTRRESNIVPIPMVMAHLGISDSLAKKWRLSSMVSRLRAFKRVRDARLEVGSLKPTWPLRTMSRILRSIPTADLMHCSYPLQYES